MKSTSPTKPSPCTASMTESRVHRAGKLLMTTVTDVPVGATSVWTEAAMGRDLGRAVASPHARFGLSSIAVGFTGHPSLGGVSSELLVIRQPCSREGDCGVVGSTDPSEPARSKVDARGLGPASVLTAEPAVAFRVKKLARVCSKSSNPTSLKSSRSAPSCNLNLSSSASSLLSHIGPASSTRAVPAEQKVSVSASGNKKFGAAVGFKSGETMAMFQYGGAPVAPKAGLGIAVEHNGLHGTPASSATLPR
mmetsp:Transcript_31407/g.91737  ORF Transcript_31407/g.91737 Transcript_31407/m.91737 type:complete len:250 (-) Transcript_31407:128-877(-)